MERISKDLSGSFVGNLEYERSPIIIRVGITSESPNCIPLAQSRPEFSRDSLKPYVCHRNFIAFLSFNDIEVVNIEFLRSFPQL